jgi:hypothetical protein
MSGSRDWRGKNKTGNASLQFHLRAPAWGADADRSVAAETVREAIKLYIENYDGDNFEDVVNAGIINNLVVERLNPDSYKVLSTWTVSSKTQIIYEMERRAGTDWYDCPRCDALYPNQECICGKNRECPKGTHESLDDALGCWKCQNASKRGQAFRHEQARRRAENEE